MLCTWPESPRQGLIIIIGAVQLVLLVSLPLLPRPRGPRANSFCPPYPSPSPTTTTPCSPHTCASTPPSTPTSGPDTRMVSTARLSSWATQVCSSFSLPRPLNIPRRRQDQSPPAVHSKQVRSQEHNLDERGLFCNEESLCQWSQGSPPALGYCWPGAFQEHGAFLLSNSSNFNPNPASFARHLCIIEVCQSPSCPCANSQS